ncbi:MAG: hypothetical protein HeimC2_01600 [Candidatus Heimdallarchaeota archaeon LC_2]|nr:MAG: hypothetical protein HeimC2_01600 [Candidatus Heimdallarchaeota archaeon LC_2]
MSYKKDIEIARTQKDQFFKKSHQSPIPHHDRNKFVSLDYYPINENYVFILQLERYDNPETIQMETSDGMIRDYFRIGFLKFVLDADEVPIHIYQQADNPDYYFIPFRDVTSGNETYGAGRYLDIEKEGEKFILDFNKAYSPYCAYNENYSCPLPPFENHLKVSILAGEKNTTY